MPDERLMKQLIDIGVHRCLLKEDIEHVICLLRIIEQLPKLSCTHGDACEGDLKKQLETIHKNHLELSESVRLVLSKTNNKKSFIGEVD